MKIKDISNKEFSMIMMHIIASFPLLNLDEFKLKYYKTVFAEYDRNIFTKAVIRFSNEGFLCSTTNLKKELIIIYYRIKQAQDRKVKKLLPVDITNEEKRRGLLAIKKIRDLLSKKMTL